MIRIRLYFWTNLALLDFSYLRRWFFYLLLLGNNSSKCLKTFIVSIEGLERMRKNVWRSGFCPNVIVAVYGTDFAVCAVGYGPEVIKNIVESGWFRVVLFLTLCSDLLVIIFQRNLLVFPMWRKLCLYKFIINNTKKILKLTLIIYDFRLNSIIV